MAEISEKEIETIRKEAQGIMEKFGKKLESVKLKESASGKEVGGFRNEGNGNKPDADFRKRMFANASEKNEDFILAEKKKW